MEMLEMKRICRTRSSTGELPVLTRMAAGSNPAGCIGPEEQEVEEQDQGESEDDMERLISLFREPASDGGYVSPSEPPRPAMQADLADLKVLDDQPIYFRQLLEYLRQQGQTTFDIRLLQG